ncbi:transcriptional regulator [Spirillospora sp. NPDC047279]|uniref:transcriptional regulator n=1 Tax=Spirillospora sp. NPDC047279 TaxID=3155478 RepID=UPI0033EFD4A3
MADQWIDPSQWIDAAPWTGAHSEEPAPGRRGRAPSPPAAGVSRRRALVTGTASLIGLGLRGRSLPPAVRQAGPAQGFKLMFEQFRRLGQISSPRLVLPGLIAQTRTLRDLGTSARPEARPELLLIASRYAEYTGWLAQESGDDEAAVWWTAQAADMATAGGDPEMAVYALVRQALVAFDRGDAARTIDLARRAQADRRAAPRVRGLAAQREAQGHALAGDYGRCRRALDRAAALLDGAEQRAGSSPDVLPPLGSRNVADPVAIAAGWCYHDLGRPRAAAEILERETARILPGALRARTRYGTRLALAYAESGEVDRACALAGRVLDEAAVVDSATIRRDVARLARSLARWSTHRPVRALSPGFAQALRV